VRRKLILISIGLGFAAGILAILWLMLDWPPPGLLLRYGFPPAGGPTGRRTTLDGVEFIELSPGYFRMGSHYGCRGGNFAGRIGEWLGVNIGRPSKHRGVECPTRWVEIPEPIWMARTEVTILQMKTITGGMPVPDPEAEDRMPVTWTSWETAGEFCEEMSWRNGERIRLPTEAEWEYACRAGTTGDYPFPGGRDRINDFVWWRVNSRRKLERVAELPANEWGFFDMLGNAAEWCEERWPGPEISDYRVIRGGCVRSPREDCRSASRDRYPQHSESDEIGFRPVMEARKKGRGAE
jgi:formylglycine-generating enzyme required for sulfatase activity